MSEWKETQIKYFGRVITGYTPATSDRELWNGEVPFYTPADFKEDVYCSVTERKLNEVALSNDRIVQENSLMVTCIASIGKIALAKRRGISNQQINTIIFNDNFDPKYCYYLIKENINELIKLAGITAVPIVNKTEFEKIYLRHHSDLTEQRQIARILSTSDSVIEKTQVAIAKYKAIKQGMLHDLFTRGVKSEKVKVKSENGDIVEKLVWKLRPKYEDAPELYKAGKLGIMPKEWDELLINDCIDPIMSNVDKHIYENEIKILLCNYMDVYNNRYMTKGISFSDGSVNASEMQRFSLKSQDVIITKDSETPDDIAVPTVLIEKVENLICGYHLCILRSKDLSKLNGEYLMLQLQIQEINSQFAIRANGSTRYGLTIDAIENVSLRIPKDINEQLGIVKRIKTIDDKLKSEQNYLQKLQAIKQGLMGDLLSGRKRVNVDVNEDIDTNGNNVIS
ncbi:MAG TPA: restriction endonuclease subunit S [Bacteroidales bacterium]|nr:restriction endonuclease subunit S [Bacteroidales bacterium]